jgi:hypothetical protein
MIGTTRPAGRSSTGLRLATAAVVLAALSAALMTAGAAHATRGAQTPNARTPPTIGGCTMASPSPRATIEARIANAADFCELVSKGLADEVFHAAVVVTPGRLWHYADAALSCSLRYRQTPGRMTIRNSAATCRWFARSATGWRREATSVAYLS